MEEKNLETILSAIEGQEKRLEDLEERLCEQRAFIHALEALVIQIMSDHGIDEEAVRASLGALLHDAPKTDETAKDRAAYLINFRRLSKSAALHHKQSRRARAHQ